MKLRSQAQEVATRILNSLVRPFYVGVERVAVHLSIGIAFTDAGAHAADTAMQHADAAMYAAKRQGGNRFVTADQGHALPPQRRSPQLRLADSAS